MSTREFGVVKPVELRELWPREAADFTPWLAEHLPSLGQALGMELELKSIEAPVGGFSLDLLARNLGRDRLVAIENQLEPTDHDHLGKLLTYAAGYNASAVVWISKEMRDEHRQALDWLNLHTDSEVEFFGVVVEVFQIDESRPAFNFKVVSAPNEWRKQGVTSVSTSRTSEREKAYRDYFQGLIDELRERHRFTGARVGQPQNWYNFSSGYPSIAYGHSFAQGGRTRVELYLDRPEANANKSLFDALLESKDSIEGELQETLEWERLDERKTCRISAVRPGTIDLDSSTLEEIKNWAVDGLLKFKRVFGPHLGRLAG